jgi:hypothetical protein
MAQDKKGFLMYADQMELFDQLSNEKAGELIKHIFQYVNDLNPVTDDLIINLAFTPIKQQLKRDLKAFEKTREQRVAAGKRSAEVRKEKRKSTPLNLVQRRSTNSTVNVNVNDNVNGIIEFDRFWNLYGKKVGRKKAELKWNKLSLQTQELILDYLPKYIKATPEVKFRKDPTTFLNNESWLDEIITEQKPIEKINYSSFI